MYSDYNVVKLMNKTDLRNHINLWKHNSTLLNEQQTTEEIKREI